jgi:hypothetical protein
MSKGFLIIAENSKSTNYVEQAYALALSIKISQKEISSVSLVTNNKVPKKLAKVFDHIITIPWTERTVESRYAVENRWKVFHVSPYDETIVLDADMLLLEDVSDWWSYCNNFDLKFCNRVKNYKLESILEDVYHRKAFNENGLTNPYFALHYFKKSEQALNFYKVLEFVCNNWEWAYNKFAPIAYQNWLSMDLASAIAIEIVGCHEAVIDTCSPLDFVHMKLPLQGWEMLPESWQDTVPFVLNSRAELIVGNIKQTKLFHYVEKNFLSKKILSRLEELASV